MLGTQFERKIGILLRRNPLSIGKQTSPCGSRLSQDLPERKANRRILSGNIGFATLERYFESSGLACCLQAGWDYWSSLEHGSAQGCRVFLDYDVTPLYAQLIMA